MRHVFTTFRCLLVVRREGTSQTYNRGSSENWTRDGSSSLTDEKEEAAQGKGRTPVIRGELLKHIVEVTSSRKKVVVDLQKRVREIREEMD